MSDLSFKRLSLPRLPFTVSAHGLLLAFAGLGLVMAVAGLVWSDWRRVAVVEALARTTARETALAAARDIGTAEASGSRRAAEVGRGMVRTRIRLGHMTPGEATFLTGSLDPDTVEVTAEAHALLPLGRWFGLRSWPVSARALARQEGLAAVLLGSSGRAALPGVAEAVEAGLLGGSGLTVTERASLGALSVNAGALAAALVHDGAAIDESGEDGGRDKVRRYPVRDVLAAALRLVEGDARRSNAGAAAFRVLSRLVQAGGDGGRRIALDDLFGSAAGDGAVSLGQMRVGLTDLLAALMRAGLRQGPLALDLDAPAEGIRQASLRISLPALASGSPTALIGSTGSRLATPPIRIEARFKAEGLALTGLRETTLSIEARLSAGDVAVGAVRCEEGGAVVEAFGRPVRVSLAFVDPEAADGGVPDLAPLVDLPAVKAWARGSSAFADDPAVPLVFRVGGGESEPRSLRALIGLDNRVEKLLGEAAILVSVKPGTGMSEAGLRSVVSEALRGAAPAVSDILGSVYATFGIRPGETELAVAAASCAHARLVGGNAP